jgi:hypothetical protein
VLVAGYTYWMLGAGFWVLAGAGCWVGCWLADTDTAEAKVISRTTRNVENSKQQEESSTHHQPTSTHSE